MTTTLEYREVPPGQAACPVCDTVVPVLRHRAGTPAIVYVHGPRADRCPGSRQEGVSWIESTRLPNWDELSDVDKGCALMFIWKVHWERSYIYARDNYPATYRDHPMLLALPVADRCRYANAVCKQKFGSFEGGRTQWPTPRRGGPLDMSERGLGEDEWKRLYDLALAADREAS